MINENEEAQYVVTLPTGFIAASDRYYDVLKQIHEDEDIKILDSLGEDSDKLLCLTPEQLTSFRERFPQLVIEPNIYYTIGLHPFLTNFQEISLPAFANTKDVSIVISDESTSYPIEDVEVFLINDTTKNSGYKGITDATGKCELTIDSNETRFPALILVPKRNYWSRYITSFLIEDQNDLQLKKLLCLSTALYDWGHVFSGMRSGMGNNGDSVKVGIIDTGVSANHPALTNITGLNCVYGEDPLDWDDYIGHGTHCAGIIAAVANNTGTIGYIPNVELRAYRVFGRNGKGALSFDIATAIKNAVEDGCDIINLSLTSPTNQATVRNKIEFAYDNGVLCIAAAGNEGKGVKYPAAFPQAMGIGAFGANGNYPTDSVHTLAESTRVSSIKNCLVAAFSNFGTELDFCAPGVAITSTVPGGYAAYDGTSMAAPHVAGIAALLLSNNPAIKNMARDSNRSDALIKLLRSKAISNGFGTIYEGSGYISL